MSGSIFIRTNRSRFNGFIKPEKSDGKKYDFSEGAGEEATSGRTECDILKKRDLPAKKGGN
jgi:hypothetical protein